MLRACLWRPPWGNAFARWAFWPVFASVLVSRTPVASIAPAFHAHHEVEPTPANAQGASDVTTTSNVGGVIPQGIWCVHRPIDGQLVADIKFWNRKIIHFSVSGSGLSMTSPPRICHQDRERWLFQFCCTIGQRWHQPCSGVHFGSSHVCRPIQHKNRFISNPFVGGRCCPSSLLPDRNRTRNPSSTAFPARYFKDFQSLTGGSATGMPVARVGFARRGQRPVRKPAGSSGYDRCSR